MKESSTTNRKKWIKIIAIVFFIILLVSTFFSNTYMNYSLAKVETVAVGSKSIEEKVRETGVVESAETYDQTVRMTRVIDSVKVSVGDEVKKGDVLMTLKECDTNELLEAKSALESLKQEYEEVILDSDFSNYIRYDFQISQTQEELKNAIKQRKQLKKAIGNVEKKKKELNKKKRQLKEKKKELAQFNNTVVKYTNIVEKYKDKIDSIESGRDKSVEDLYTDYKDARNELEKAEDKYTTLTEQKDDIEKEIDKLGFQSEKEGNRILETAKSDLEKLNTEAAYVENRYNFRDEYEPYSYSEYIKDKANVKRDIENKKKEVEEITEDIETLKVLQEKLSIIAQSRLQARENLIQCKDDFFNAQQEYESTQSDSVSGKRETLGTAQKKLEVANRKANKLNTDAELLDYDIGQLERNLEAYKEADERVEEKNAQFNQAVAELKEKRNDDTQGLNKLIANKNALEEKIELQKDIVENLENKLNTKVIKAAVSGTIRSLNVTAGSTALEDSVVCSINAKDKMYKLSITVTNVQSKKIKVNDVGEVSSFNGKVEAVVRAIKTNPADAANTKIVEFDITGEDIKLGQIIQVSVGSNSSEYDFVVPNSSVYSDNAGKFVYVIKANNSSLGNTYIVKRVSVKVLASNDTQTAVEGDFAASDSVVSSASKLIKHGDKVMLKIK